MNAMNHIQDRDPVAASRRLVAVDAARRAIEDDLNQFNADLRDAAILNMILLAKVHGSTRDFTAEDVRRWRMIRAHTDATVIGGEEEVIPSGFGPALRTEQAAAFVRLAAKAATSPAKGATDAQDRDA